MFEDSICENLEKLLRAKVLIGQISGYQGTSTLRSLDSTVETCVNVLNNLDEKHLTLYSGDVETIIREIRYFQQLLDGIVSEYRHDKRGAINAIAVESVVLDILNNLIEMYYGLYIQDEGVRPGLNKAVIDRLSKETRNHLYSQRDMFMHLAGIERALKDSFRKHAASSIYYDIRYDFDAFTRFLNEVSIPQYVRDGASKQVIAFSELKPSATHDSITAKEFREALKAAVEEHYLPIKPYLKRRYMAYAKAYRKATDLVDTYR